MGVEMYPSCAQISVTGGSDGGLPSATVKFPGAYKQDDPGLLIKNVSSAYSAYLICYLLPSAALAIRCQGNLSFPGSRCG